MASPRGRRASGPETLSISQAKEKYLDGIRAGLTNTAAMQAAGRTEKTLENWRKDDPAFKAKADQIRLLAKADVEARRDARDIDFASFSEKYLGQRCFRHQLQWIDALEGREPRELHPAQMYIKGDPTRLIINTPPAHAKSTTITMNYVTYRVCMDPNTRVIVVSQTQDMARKFLAGIKSRLDNPRFRQLQADFAPQGGWKATADAWRADWIYIGADGRDSGDKDPTVQALGMGGQIYGARADLIILDDAITLKNAHEWAKQMDWLNQEVDTRLEPETGQLLIVGTRVDSVDLYKELRNPDHYGGDEALEDEDAPWTYLSQPAVLETAERPEDWVTLWPKSDDPGKVSNPVPDENGLYPRWDGTRLSKIRRKLGPRRWALVYMQQDVSEDSVFGQREILGCQAGQRRVGPLVAGALGHRPTGMDGLYVIGSIDPSGSGDSAFVVYAVDRQTKKRYVLNAKVMTPWVWAKVRALVQEWTLEYGIHEWVIEKNMYHANLTMDEEISSWLQEHGIRLQNHFTSGQKQDPDLGVMSLAPLFGTKAAKSEEWVTPPLIELPSSWKSDGTAMLVSQLVTWQPAAPKNQKTDLVMALWFAETRAREILIRNRREGQGHLNNPYATGWRKQNQKVVSLHDLRAAKLAAQNVA